MSKAYDLRSWGSGLYYDAQNRPHVEENRLIHVTEMNQLATADNRNSISRILAEMLVAPADTNDPSRVRGDTLGIDQPHPDSDLGGSGCRVRGYSVRVLNQFEALVTVRYMIPYADNYWGATAGGVPEMSVREATEWIEIPTIYDVVRAGGVSSREVFGVRRVERTTLYVTISDIVTVPNFAALATNIGDAFGMANKLDPNPFLGSDVRLKNTIILGAHLRADYNTSSAQGGPGRFAFVVQRRWTAPIKKLDAATPRIEIPAVPANGEIVVALTAAGVPEYKVIAPEDNYTSLPVSP